jgi:kynurenine 3-monooxygenase
VDRARLNELLLTAAERMSNVTVYFEHRLSRVDFDKNQLEFITADESTSVYESDLIVGADGAYSRTRQQIMRHMR